jgi:uncharacterized RDD family membrane protein YckC
MDIMPSDLPGDGAPLGSFADKLTIETPEQTALEFAVAGIGSRFLALAVDTLIQMLVGFIVGLGGSILIGVIAAAMPVASLWGFAILVLFFFFLYFGYFALFEIIWNGQTPGKRKAGIRVIKDSGRPLTPAESIGRNLMRIVDWLPAFYAVGIVCAMLTRGNKRLGDLVAGSLVVRESSFSDLKSGWQSSQAPSGPALSPLGAGRLSAQECSLIDSFLNRRFDLEPDVRFRMADEIFRRLKPKLTLPAENTLSTERILEALAYERRSTGHYT